MQFLVNYYLRYHMNKCYLVGFRNTLVAGFSKQARLRLRSDIEDAMFTLVCYDYGKQFVPKLLSLLYGFVEGQKKILNKAKSSGD